MKSHLKLSKSQLQSLSELTHKKHRMNREMFLIEGIHLVSEALASDWDVEAVIVSEAFIRNSEYDRIRSKSKSRGIEICTVSEKEVVKLADTVTSQGVFAVVRQKKYILDEIWRTKKHDLLIVALESVSDPGNVGTILRTCDWFGVDAVLLGGESVELFNPKVVRSTMGALFHVPVLTDVDLNTILPEAKRNGCRVIATTLEGGTRLVPDSLTGKNLILFGNEAHGLSPKLVSRSDVKITIPRFGEAESLNVSAACAVMLGCMRIKRV